MKLTRAEAQELLYSRTDPYLRLQVELDEQVDIRRWVSVHRLIVKDADGRFWETSYEKGLTEYQDIEPFEDDNEVSFVQVEKVPVTAYEYRRTG